MTGKDPLDALLELGISQKATFSPDRVVPSAPGVKPKEEPERNIPLYGQYADFFYASKPSAELLDKERERFFDKDSAQQMRQSDIKRLEEGLCAKYRISPPKNIKNNIRNGALEDDEHILAIGTTIDDRRHPKTWGINQLDRTYHTHLLGPSGSGKSTLLRQMLVQDLWYHRGGLLLEPHGDLSLNCLMATPPYRIHDTIYLNVLDKDYSPGFNPLDMPADVSDAERYESVAEVVALMLKHFEVQSSSVRLLKVLENALNALSYVPGATILEIMDFYNNPDIQASVLSFMPESPLKDNITSVTLNTKPDDLASLENRISRFNSNRLLKHLFGQSKSTIDFEREINRGSMVICPVPKGGTKDEFFLHFYGEYIVSVVYKAAMMRESMDEKERIIFPLTIDEFQNFMSGDIENMLAELRKYGLPLCLAHQYLGQLDGGIWDAINNSCRTKLTYRLGSNDAPVMAKAFPGITANDLMSIQKYHVMAQPLIHGQEQRPFLTKLFMPLENLSPSAQVVADLVVEFSRSDYMTPRDEIESDIEERKERLASGNKEAIIEMASRKNR